MSKSFSLRKSSYYRRMLSSLLIITFFLSLGTLTLLFTKQVNAKSALDTSKTGSTLALDSGETLQYTLQGLVASTTDNWTTGNLCQGGGACYSEGDNVPSRLTINGLTAGNIYSVIIEHHYLDSEGTMGYENFNRDPLYTADVNATNVSIVEISTDSCASVTCKQYLFTFTATGTEAIIYWNSLLSMDASEWNGSRLHFKLLDGVCIEFDANGNCTDRESIGNKEVPITVGQIEVVPTPTPTPTITITPTVTVTTTPEPTVSPTLTPTVTPTLEPTVTITPSITPEPTTSPTVTVEPTPTVTITSTPIPTLTPTQSVSPTPTQVVTPTVEPTPNAINPVLFIEKSNNRQGIDLFAGSNVTYTLKITARTDNVNDVYVTDTLPVGFVYRQGSWKSTSTVRGDLNATTFAADPVTTEPVYNSTTGVWYLGNMVEDEVVTLSYIADIQTDKKPGLYKDLAWAYGTSNSALQVLANNDSGYFVGTDVQIITLAAASNTPIVLSETESINTVINPNLLPQTGLNSSLLKAVAMTFASGIALITLGVLISLSEKLKKFKSLIFVAVMLLGFAGLNTNALAAPKLNVRIEQPKTPTNFVSGIDFVALDITGKEISIECLKKSPQDTDFVTFLQKTSNGGSGICELNSDTITSNGEYEFKVLAKTDAETIESNVVSVVFDTTKPSTPVSYSKSELNSCKYTLRYTTANDSETTKVQIYKSTSTEFDADINTFVTEIAIGPNQSGIFEDTVSDCTKESYYAIRAMDDAGNASEFIADSVVVVKTVEVSPTIIAPVVVDNTTQNIDNGEVLGENTVNETTISPTVTPKAGEVLGESTTNQPENKEKDAASNDSLEKASSSKNYLYGGLAVLGVAVTGSISYVFLKKGKK